MALERFDIREVVVSGVIGRFPCLETDDWVTALERLHQPTHLVPVPYIAALELE